MPESLQYRSPQPTLLDAEEVKRPIASVEVALKALAEAGIDTVMMQDGPLLVGAAKLAITQSEARYRHLINQIGGFVAELRLSGEVVYANEALVRLLQCDAQEILGSNFFDQLNKVHASPRLDNFDQLFAEKRDLIDFRTDLQGPTTSAITVAWYTAHIAGANASQGRAFLLGLDITAKVRAEDEVRIASIAFDSQEGMVVTDESGAILRVNRAFTDITGYTADDVFGRNSRLLQSDRQDADFFKGMWKSISETAFWQGEIWNRRKSGEVYPSWLTITAVKAADGSVIAYVGAFLDITHRKAADSQIERLAFYDPLTQLANRRLLLDRLKRAMSTCNRRKRHCALVLIDLDNFKSLNDTLGHDVGDLLLIEVGRRLTIAVREGDTVARFGGDEFVVILEDLDGSEVAALQAEAVALKIQERLRQVYLLEVRSELGLPHTHSHRCSSSVGVALYLDESVSPEELIKHADVAMYQAKSAGRDALRFFNPAMQAAVDARTGLENELRIAIDAQQFNLAYQIQVNAFGEAVSTEALIRWNHPKQGFIAPLEFIQLAEETGLIFPIGRWVIEEACQQLVRWSQHPRLSTLSIAVNVSARQFHSENFANQVLEILEATGANPKRLKLELTESLLAKNLDQVVVKMKTLKNIGVSFSLDDFGTGYSSLAYLKRLPIDELKIDKSFIGDVLNNSNDAVIARTVVSLGQSLGLRVIAEGVETAEQRDFLLEHGCKLFQGYHFGHPTSIRELESKFL